VSYSNLVEGYTRLNRFGDARRAVEEATSKKVDSPNLHFHAYEVGFLQHDAESMAQQIAWASGKPQGENIMLYLQAEVAGYGGQLAKAREFSRQAVVSSLSAEQKGIAARCEAAAALREATFGNAAEARQRAAAAMAFSRGSDEQFVAGLALAMVGDVAAAQSLTDDLAKRYPLDTIAQSNYLPTLRGQLALERAANPSNGEQKPVEAMKAVEALQPAGPYEFGVPGNSALTISLYPIYVRGMAYLQAGQGAAAVVEFQKIVEHPGAAVAESIGVLAYLGLARGFAMNGDATEAKAAYDEFFQLWRNADSDIPVLKAAKARYAKLK
jgi:hypothetical protein